MYYWLIQGTGWKVFGGSTRVFFNGSFILKRSGRSFQMSESRLKVSTSANRNVSSDLSPTKFEIITSKILQPGNLSKSSVIKIKSYNTLLYRVNAKENEKKFEQANLKIKETKKTFHSCMFSPTDKIQYEEEKSRCHSYEVVQSVTNFYQWQYRPCTWCETSDMQYSLPKCTLWENLPTH